MGWGMLSEPGTQYGPCKESCEHTDCAATRKDAATKCTICGETIGYGTKFYYTDEGAEHALCTWKKEEERKKALKAGGQ